FPHLIECILKSPKVFFTRILAKQLAGQSLELGADLVDASGLLRREAGHDRASMRHDLDQSLGLELAQGLSDERTADTRDFAKRSLRQAFPRFEPPDGDRVADALCYALPKRSRCPVNQEIVTGEGGSFCRLLIHITCSPH